VVKVGAWVVRVGEALADRRRDQRESAATIARELMLDQTSPHHVRSHAATNLARWSQPCREEARPVLHADGPLVGTHTA